MTSWLLGVLPTETITGLDTKHMNTHSKPLIHWIKDTTTTGVPEERNAYLDNCGTENPTTRKAALFRPLGSAPKTYIPLPPSKLQTQFPSCPTHKWRNGGSEKFMASWPQASNWQNLDADQSIGLQTLHTLKYYTILRKEGDRGGKGKYTI